MTPRPPGAGGYGDWARSQPGETGWKRVLSGKRQRQSHLSHMHGIKDLRTQSHFSSTHLKACSYAFSIAPLTHPHNEDLLSRQCILRKTLPLKCGLLYVTWWTIQHTVLQEANSDWPSAYRLHSRGHSAPLSPLLGLAVQAPFVPEE